MKKRFKRVYIEITNICNLNCRFCAKSNRTKENMPSPLFEKIASQIKPLCQEISLHLLGEPLLHPEIVSIIKISENLGLNINLTTNGSLITKHKKLLLSKAIQRINFSLHSLVANFESDQLLIHLNEIIKFTKFAQLNRPDLLITYRLWNSLTPSHDKLINANCNQEKKKKEKKNQNQNKLIENEIQKAFDFVINKNVDGNDEIGGHNENENNNGNILTDSLKQSKKQANNLKKGGFQINPKLFIHYDYEFEWPNIHNPIIKCTGFCQALKTHFGVLVDGTVIPCCLDHNGTINLGNLNNSNILDIIDSKQAQNIREGFKQRKLVHELCKKCTYITKFDI